MNRHVANAETVATWLEEPSSRLVVCGLRSSNSYKSKNKYFPMGCDLFLRLVLRVDTSGTRLVEGCTLLSHLANVGDTRSLILHPASTTHRQLTEDQQIAAGAGPDVVRISVGIKPLKILSRTLIRRFAASETDPRVRSSNNFRDFNRIANGVAEIDGPRFYNARPCHRPLFNRHVTIPQISNHL